MQFRFSTIGGLHQFDCPTISILFGYNGITNSIVTRSYREKPTEPTTYPCDEIIAINGRKVEGLVHAEVVALFREVRRGAITIQLGRKLPKDRDGLYITADQLTQLAAMPNGDAQ
ncbi:Uncharacterized protein APZ42_013379 [Daphnia magna]|uniref:PDZ domain-containing protein n=1 Tax=Daphnia magna TaxID=35525 RepID=A0A162QXY4_9CRUS|nr:Uncharacterized protein APZ42_013379 [Daphnia magna]